jgi:DNA-binding IclR family transcriptional regulator
MERTPVESLRKGLDILDLLCGAGREGLTLAQVAEQMGLKRTTTHNLLKTLSMCGHAQNLGDGRYRVGPKVAEFARLLTAAVPVSPRMAGMVGRLAGELNENVVLTTLAGGRRRVLARALGAHAVQVDSCAMEGAVGYLWQTPTGRVLAARCTPDELDGVLAHEGMPAERWQGIDSGRGLERALEAVRQAGFAEQHEREVAALAVPVEGAGGSLLGALGMHMPEYRWRREMRDKILDALRNTAAQLTAAWSDGFGLQWD